MDSINETAEAFGAQNSVEKGLGSSPEKETQQRAHPGDLKRIRSSFSTLVSLGSWKRPKTIEPECSSGEDLNPYIPNIRKLEEAPWGFPRLARYSNSDESFMIYRRFGEMLARLLLYKQDELTELEEQMQEMDLLDSEDEEQKKRLMSRKLDNARSKAEGQGQKRRKLLAEVEKKSLEYYELLAKAQHLAEMRAPSRHDCKSVNNFLNNDGGQIFPWERRYILEKEDLVTLKPTREYAWLDSMVERALRRFRCQALEYIFCSKETLKKTDDKAVRYYSRERISRFVTLVITAFILVLLIVPVWLLWRSLVQDSIAKSPSTVILLVVFTLVFSAGLSMFTKAKRHEILAASAGYCALLVVFLGNGNNNI